MAFFNYSTMQMTAKIVYYGPGLCGKTTNLQFIYGHTTDDSRGEMVSLETQTDRTLFFDLLPMEVGKVAGFRTRIQLYTVPGQVFYNTTRKLVLKGVDGIVFVADSQRPMLRTNVESLSNLRDNLEELGISLDEIPLVLQFNKRDLNDVVPTEDLAKALGGDKTPHFTASAITGQGVFETLRGISKLTLVSLKKQLEASHSTSKPLPRAPEEKTAVARPGPVRPPAARPSAAAPTKAAAKPRPKPRAKPAPKVAAGPAPKAPPPGPRPDAGVPKSVAGNGRLALSRNLMLDLGKEDLRRARQVQLHLKLQDESDSLVHEVRDIKWDLSPDASPEEIVLRLEIALSPKD